MNACCQDVLQLKDLGHVPTHHINYRGFRQRQGRGWLRRDSKGTPPQWTEPITAIRDEWADLRRLRKLIPFPGSKPGFPLSS